MSRYFTSVVIAAGALGIALAGGCSTAPSTAEGKASLESEASTVVAKARANHAAVATMLDGAHSYAVFPTVGKGAVVVGGAYGKGVLFQGGSVVGFCDLTQASIGAALGGQAYSEIIAFEHETATNRFKSGNFSFAAQATAVALKSGAGANAKYEDGVAVFTLGESGLMYEASIGGQKFSYQAK